VTKRTHARLLGALLAAAAAGTPAYAERAAAVPANLPRTLVVFDTTVPAAVTLRTVTGLNPTDSIVGIDVRPATGQLYAVAAATGTVANSILWTYTIDPDTGAATLIGQTSAALAGAADIPTGVDFNPTVDRIRLVNTNDENARLNPTNGTLAGNDVDLTPAVSATLIAAAYDRNTPGAAATTLYGIDRALSRLVVQGGADGNPSPNGGVISTIGPLGFTLDPASDGGFDVAASGTAYAALTDNADDRTRLYTINLATGAATAVGELPTAVRSLTILPPIAPPPPPPPPPADTLAPAGLVDVGAGARLRTLQGAGVVLGFSCDEACTAAATLTARGVVVARGQGTLAAAGVGSLTLSPAAEGSRVLRRARRAGRLRGTLATTFTDAAGNASQRERPLDLRR
jgi:hypothetical protein